MPGMRNLKLASLLLALGPGAAACGDDEVGPGEWTIDDLVGTWVITQLEYTAYNDPDETFDVIDEGTSGTITINGNGNYTLTLSAPGPIPSPTTGTYTSSSAVIPRYVFCLQAAPLPAPQTTP